jgi:hypothetical protein
MNVVPSVDAAPQSVRMRFSGTEHSLFKILLRGSLLQIPTFGFYRFWLTTDVRRHLWSHTEIGPDSFEYTGRGRELLIGFLIALAILVPIYIVYFLLTLEAERLMAFASVPLVLILYALGYYALYRARRYRASRTVFRGVRFWMTGSGLAYLGRAAIWDLLTLVTLGFAYAWRSAALESYKMRHTRYGSLEGSFTASGWTLFKRAGWIWAIYLFIAVMVGVFAIQQDWISTAVLGVALLIASIFILPAFHAIELRWWLEGVGFGPVTVETDLTIGAVMKCYFRTFLFWMVYSAVGGTMLSIAIGVAVGIGTLVMGPIDETTIMTNIPLLVVGGAFGGLLYIVFLLGFGIVSRLFFDRGIWAATVNSVTLSNLGAVDHVVAAGGEVPSGVGEGLLDALDFGGGV